MIELHRPKAAKELALTVAAEPGGIKMAARLDAKKAPTVAFRSRSAWAAAVVELPPPLAHA